MAIFHPSRHGRPEAAQGSGTPQAETAPQPVSEQSFLFGDLAQQEQPAAATAPQPAAEEDFFANRGWTQPETDQPQETKNSGKKKLLIGAGTAMAGLATVGAAVLFANKPSGGKEAARAPVVAGGPSPENPAAAPSAGPSAPETPGQPSPGETLPISPAEVLSNSFIEVYPLGSSEKVRLTKFAESLLVKSDNFNEVVAREWAANYVKVSLDPAYSTSTQKGSDLGQITTQPNFDTLAKTFAGLYTQRLIGAEMADIKSKGTVKAASLMAAALQINGGLASTGMAKVNFYPVSVTETGIGKAEVTFALQEFGASANARGVNGDLFNVKYEFDFRRAFVTDASGQQASVWLVDGWTGLGMTGPLN